MAETFKPLILTGGADNIAQQAFREHSFAALLGRLRAEAVSGGMTAESMVRVLRAALDQEERLLAEQRANERSY